MVHDNRVSIMHILDAVSVGLGPYVLAKYRQAYGEEYLRRLVKEVGRLDEQHLDSEVKIIDAFDTHRWLKAMTRYKDIFLDELGSGANRGRIDFNRSNAISFAYELLAARNVWAHTNASDQFDDDGVYRIAENAARLLSVVGAKTESEMAKKIMRDVGRRMYCGEAGNTGPELAQVQQRLASSRQDLADSKKELASIKLKNSTIAKEQVSTRRELATTKGKLTATKKDLKAAEAELSSTKKQLQETEHNLHAKEQELAASKRQLLETIAELEFGDIMSRSNMSAGRSATSRGHSTVRKSAAAGPPSGVSVNEMNLGGQNLRGKDLTRQDLTNAALANADLSGARLCDVKLSDANLVNANLSEADMTGANMRGANLTGADLRNATLKNADLTDAVLVGARLQGALDKSTVLPDGTFWTPSRAMNNFLRA